LAFGKLLKVKKGSSVMFHEWGGYLDA
jgi:hypothetical protein